MAQFLRKAHRHALGFVAFAVLLGLPAAAQPISEQVGALALALDGKSWRIERSADGIVNIVPIGAMAKTARTVIVTRAASKDLGDCEDLARAQLPASLYGEPTSREVNVGGLKAVAFNARTRCRNATPTGMVVCIPYRGVGYLLTNRISGCRSSDGNPFSGSGWFEDLMSGIRFMP